jgi:hypothetical protein
MSNTINHLFARMRTEITMKRNSSNVRSSRTQVYLSERAITTQTISKQVKTLIKWNLYTFKYSRQDIVPLASHDDSLANQFFKYRETLQL